MVDVGTQRIETVRRYHDQWFVTAGYFTSLFDTGRKQSVERLRLKLCGLRGTTAHETSIGLIKHSILPDARSTGKPFTSLTDRSKDLDTFRKVAPTESFFISGFCANRAARAARVRSQRNTLTRPPVPTLIVVVILQTHGVGNHVIYR